MALSMDTEHQNLYPVYGVYEKHDENQAEVSSRFKVGDPLFRSQALVLPEASQYAAFTAWTENGRLVLEVEYDRLAEGQQGELTLFFDPDLSRRKFGNAFVFIVKKDGTLKYQEYRYELVETDIPQDVDYSHAIAESRVRVRLSLPFRLLRLEHDLAGRRAIGFNAIRSVQAKDEDNPSGENTLYMTWSGVKGDRIHFGQGAGVLLFAEGLEPNEVNKLSDEIALECKHYFTVWKKQKVPAELQSFVQEKKKGLTVYLNEEDAERARHNAETTAWGKKMKIEILKAADFWAAKSDSDLYDLVPAGNPREVSPSVFFGDPLTGGKGNVFQMCLERPYQIYNSQTKEWWYNGKTIKNPATGETITFQDEGEGFVAPEGFPNPGVRYMFTASYRLFLWSMLLGNPRCIVLEDREACPETSGYAYAGAIPNLAFAYQLTLNPEYALKALILIGRIAELYPYMNGKFPSPYDTVQIAEPTTSESFWLCNYFAALVLIYDTVDRYQPRLTALFAQKPDAENKPRMTPFNLKQAVSGMIPVVLHSCEIEKRRTADWSIRWISVEVVVASFMQSGRLMRHILDEGPASLQSKVRNSFFRDGRYSYDSMSYIERISQQISLLANFNYRLRDGEHFPDGIDMFEDERFGLNKAIALYGNLRCGTLIPMFGDVQGINNKEPISEDRKKGKFPYSPTFEIIFRRMPSCRSVIGSVLSRFSQQELEEYRTRTVNVSKNTFNEVETKYKLAFLLLATAGSGEEYRQYEEDGRDDIENSEAIQPSLLVEDSQISIFRSGTTPHNCKHVVLYGQPSSGHRHGDKLGLWIGAYGYNLLTGIGDYPYTWVSPKWTAWESHSAACAVVVVDGKDQGLSYSRQKCHYEGKLLQISGMENTTAYPGTHLERWCWVVRCPNAEDAYIVDLNDVSGGSVFDYNTIGLDSSFERIPFAGVGDGDWIPMKGTLAGEQVPLYSEPGYAWMKALKKAPEHGPVDWTYTYEGAALKVHALPTPGQPREIVCALGERGGQEPGNSRWEPFVMWRDDMEHRQKNAQISLEAESHAASFVAVLEPYEHQPFIHSVKRMHEVLSTETSRFKPAGIEIAFPDGHLDVLIRNYAEGDRVRCRDSQGNEYETDARALLLRMFEGELIGVEAVGYTFVEALIRRRSDEHSEAYKFARKAPACTGTIADIDIEARRITVEMDLTMGSCDLSDLEGKVALIDSADYVKPSTYRMINPRLDGNQLSFESDMSLLLHDEDWKSPHKSRSLGRKSIVDVHGKRVYTDIKPGDEFKVLNALQVSPLNHELKEVHNDENL